MNFHLNRLLENLTEDKLPFTLNGLTGIIMLDHPPEFCEVERHILAKIAEFIPIHQSIQDNSDLVTAEHIC